MHSPDAVKEFCLNSVTVKPKSKEIQKVAKTLVKKHQKIKDQIKKRHSADDSKDSKQTITDTNKETNNYNLLTKISPSKLNSCQPSMKNQLDVEM